MALIVAAVTAIVGLRSDAPQADYLLQTQTKTYALEAATTLSEQEKGLGGRNVLGQNSGMLFVYEESKERCFWMKDMQLPLDIIWVAPDKTVTHIEPSLSQHTFPRHYCADAQYIIELNAGEADFAGIKVGSKVDFRRR